MSYRYRVICVVFGLVILGLGSYQSWAQERVEFGEKGITVPPPLFGLIEQSEKPEQLTNPCEIGEDNRNSDLCAQWKAADAADKSAYWSGSTFWLGVFGAVIGTFTLIAAVAAAFYAKSAVKAAWGTIGATREVGRDQTRAYVHMKSICWVEDGERFVCTCYVENSGDTPCLRFGISAVMTISRPGNEIVVNTPVTVKRVGWSGLPGHDVYTCVITPEPMIPIEQIVNRSPNDLLIISGTIEYETFFAERFISEFSFMGRERGIQTSVKKEGTRMSRTTVPVAVFKRSGETEKS